MWFVKRYLLPMIDVCIKYRVKLQLTFIRLLQNHYYNSLIIVFIIKNKYEYMKYLQPWSNGNINLDYQIISQNILNYYIPLQQKQVVFVVQRNSIILIMTNKLEWTGS